MLARVVGIGLFVLLYTGQVFAAPRWVRITFPSDPAHQMNVSWNTDSQAGSQVEYGTTNSYGMNASGSSENAGGQCGIVHSATLTNLDPDTTYHYRVGDSSDGWSSDYTFTTAPVDVCTPWSFGVAADNRSQVSGTSPCWPTVLQAIVDQGVSFVINTGDLVEGGEEIDQWADYFESSESQTAEVPVMSCIGNHDDGPGEGDGANYNKLMVLPRNSVSNTEDFHSFDYGNVHFAVLSSQTFRGGDSHYQIQHDWLEADLAATDKMWKVVYQHRPIYSSGDHGTNEDGQNPIFIPLFDQYHVDLVITGHDHIYERYRPIHNGQEVSSWDDGTCYIVSGGGGAFVDLLYPGRPKEDHLETGDNRNHYVFVSVANNVMHVKAVNVDGGGCYQGGTGVVDEFDIVKTLTDNPCDNPIDNDQDGYNPPIDCDDNDASVHPGAQEVECDLKDNDCSASTPDDPDPTDADSDSYSVGCGQDCDDTESSVNPNAQEVCGDGLDNNCDGQTDEGNCENCLDTDSDGFNALTGDCPSGTDCNDADATVYPTATEQCNGVDDDCDALTDEDDVCGSDCVDSDGDGYFAMDANCPSGNDCDDLNGFINPGAAEICGDGIDQDCSGQDLQCGCQDQDADGYTDHTCGGPDCDDSDVSVYPGASEGCNGKDNDCNGIVDDAPGVISCGTGACAVTVGQCNDCQPLTPPESPETSCDDGLDNDCDGQADGDDPDCQASDSGCGCRSHSPGAGSVLGLFFLMFWLRRRTA